MKPDAIIRVRFKTSAENGRDKAVVGNVDYYACPLFVDGEAFDCRIYISGMRLELGEYYELPVKFLNRDLVIPKLKIGKEIILWEGKDVATGVVVNLTNP